MKRLLPILLLAAGCAPKFYTTTDIYQNLGAPCYSTRLGVAIFTTKDTECPPRDIVEEDLMHLAARLPEIPLKAFQGLKVVFTNGYIVCGDIPVWGCTRKDTSLVYYRGLHKSWGKHLVHEVTHGMLYNMGMNVPNGHGLTIQDKKRRKATVDFWERVHGPFESLYY